VIVAVMEAHLDDDAILDVLEGRAGPDTRARVEGHAASCAACRELLSALARQRDVSGSAPTLVSKLSGASESESDLPPQIGRFVLTHLLGAGGMGIVYAASDPELDRVVAVKLLRSELVDELRRPAMEERLHREARAMAKLSHPNVVAVYDVGTHDGRVFIAMEYVEGEALAKWLESPRTLASILDAFRAAGSGLAAAHAQGVVHRDFKPGNVLVGDDGRVRVTDFGIAKLEPGPRSPTARPLAMTATNAAMGTPQYMAPEQYLGEPVDARADQFSFCVALYAAIYGVRPFAGTTIDELAAAVIAGRIASPTRTARVPARIHAALVRGLAATPADRFPTLDALLAELVLPPARRTRLVAIVASAVAIGAGAIAIAASSHAREGAHELTLPALVSRPRTSGPSLSPMFVEAAAADQLGSKPFAATWCAPRQAVVITTAYGRVVGVTRDGTVTTLGKFPFTTRTNNSAVTCLASGRIVGVIRGSPFVVDGDTPATPGSLPDDVVDAVAVGDTAHWVGPGGLWAWSGTGAATRIRASCPHPLRLAPDGERVVCAQDNRLVVDTGDKLIEGPTGERAAWSRDGHAVYVTSTDTIRRWQLDGGVGLVASGADPIEVGPWLVAKYHRELVRSWLGPGPEPAIPVLDLGWRGEAATLIAAIPPDHVVVTYGERGVRVVPLDGDVPEFAPNRHLAAIVALAFSPDGTTLYSADADGLVLARTFPSTTRTIAGRLVEKWGAEPVLVARADRALVVAGQHVAGRFDATGVFVRWPTTLGMLGPVVGSDDVVAALLDDGIVSVAGDGTRGATLYPGPLPRGLAGVAVDPSSRTGLLRVGSDLVELVDLAEREVIFSLTIRGKTTQRVALVGGAPARIAIADTSGQVFAAGASGVVPIVKLAQPITALAGSPVGHRIAVGAGREVVMIDLDREIEIGTGTLDSTATALAWSRDGRRLAAAAASSQVAIWQLPTN